MRPDYWASRTHLRYYQLLTTWIEECSANSIIDVGGGPVPLVTRGWFENRTVVDVEAPDEPLSGVTYLTSPWQDLKIKEPLQANLVICSQVLEHIEDEIIHEFTDKLFQAATDRGHRKEWGQ